MSKMLEATKYIATIYNSEMRVHLMLGNALQCSFKDQSRRREIIMAPYLSKIAPDPEPVDCRILTAALNLFVDRGYHNVSVHDIQKKANVSIGSIYHHFKGKEGIAKNLYYHLLQELEEMVDSVVKQDIGNRERCNELIRLLFEYTESHPSIISYILHVKHREFLSDQPIICNSTPFVAMRNIVQHGMDEGKIRTGDPWVVASSIFGSAIRLIHLRLDGIIEHPLPSLYEETIEYMWQGLLPEISAESKNTSQSARQAQIFS